MSHLTPLQQRRLASTGCPVLFDDLTRQLYATDASIYQVEPVGVAFPRNAGEVSAVIGRAVEEGIPVIPRGAGTGLAGGALGEGLVVDFSRYHRAISDLDLERGTVRVEAGVVLDQLNGYLKPHGVCFGPDVATSSRATLGGMIGNNSSGARTGLYGTTIDHVERLEIVLADGTRKTVGGDDGALGEIHAAVAKLIADHADAIREWMPEGLVKRWPGYGIERWLRRRADLTRILGGSEGTLAAVMAAELRVSPLPKRKGVVAICFASVTSAMSATVDLLDLSPAAIEHIDAPLFDQTRGRLAFRRARQLLRLDEEPCEAILLVEFFDEFDDRVRALLDRGLGLRSAAFTGEEDMEHIWNLRKAGLSLLTSRAGPAKPQPGIEDAAVRPADLPAYVEGLQGIMAGLGLTGSFYGHAAPGLLHVRPIVDLHRGEDIGKFRKLAEETSALVKRFKGSIAAEHGVGIARTEFLPEHLGPELMEVMGAIKGLFDPKGLMNPGKIIGDGRYTFDTRLRQGAGHGVPAPFSEVIAFAKRDLSFVGNLEQCNGNGACRKGPPVMCPTFRASGEERYSTRGYANTIRAVLEGRAGNGDDPVTSATLWETLSRCLSCKACAAECPSNVNMPLLKAQLLHGRHERRGTPLGTRVLSRPDVLGSLGTLMPRVANGVLRSGALRGMLERVTGISAKRPLPAFAGERFDTWFRRREGQGEGVRGEVYLWDDCFIRHHDPRIGRAAVRVLEAAGYRVRLVEDRACCGRPAFSLGRLEVARAMGEHNRKLLEEGDGPVIFLEPSCYSMFADDYEELGLGRRMAERSVLFEDFVEGLLRESPDALPLRRGDGPVVIHGHCHAKSLVEVGPHVSLAERVSGGGARMLAAGCCGMAGAYGMVAETYDFSLEIARPLVEQVEGLGEGTRIVASGTSCRHQLEHLAGVTPMHMAELLAGALA